MADDALSIDVEPEDGALLVAVSGEVDLATAPRLRQCLDNVEPEWAVVTLDLGEVTFMDSNGLILLIQAHRRLAARGSQLQLRSVPAHLLRLFQVTDLDAHLKVV